MLIAWASSYYFLVSDQSETPHPSISHALGVWELVIFYIVFLSYFMERGFFNCFTIKVQYRAILGQKPLKLTEFLYLVKMGPTWGTNFNAHSSIQYLQQQKTLLLIILMNSIILGTQAAKQVIYFSLWLHHKLTEQLKANVEPITNMCRGSQVGSLGRGVRCESSRAPGRSLRGTSGAMGSFPVQERRKWGFLAQKLGLCYP